MRLAFYLLFTLSVSMPINSIAQNLYEKAPVVSMLQLISNPERFDGKVVTIIGFLTLEHEGDLLYPNKSDYENVVLADTLWINATEEMGKQRAGLVMKYVRIVGKFQAGHIGRNTISPGGITEIKECEFWSDPDHPLVNRIRSMMESKRK